MQRAYGTCEVCHMFCEYEADDGNEAIVLLHNEHGIEAKHVFNGHITIAPAKRKEVDPPRPQPTFRGKKKK